MTYHNIRLVIHVRQQPNQTRRSMWEQQMTRMMLIQTLLSVFCSISRAIFLIYTIAAFNERAMRGFDQISIELVIDYLSVSIMCVNFASSFYIFFLSSSRLRQTIKIYLKHLFNLNQNQVVPTIISLKAPIVTGRQTGRAAIYPTISTQLHGK
ncbi:unnamed protein product [Rotaria sordida]|uniref:Uncharacterized protein n=1 Tax=Rotaria sordida TaxID=392033 RepID=A0A819G4M0_9BILA|nr:unnamed protein product [Rotaria sordida]